METPLRSPGGSSTAGSASAGWVLRHFGEAMAAESWVGGSQLVRAQAAVLAAG